MDLRRALSHTRYLLYWYEYKVRRFESYQHFLLQLVNLAHRLLGEQVPEIRIVGSNPTYNVMGETKQTQETGRTDIQRVFEEYDEVWIGIA